MDLDAAYRILGCSPADSNDLINQRYRSLVRKYHPDVIGSADSSEFLLATEARRTILSSRQGQTADVDDTVSDMALNAEIDAAIDEFIDNARAEYCTLRAGKIRSHVLRMENYILHSKSTSEIRSVIEENISEEIASLRNTITAFVKRTENQAKELGIKFTYRLFFDIYSDYRDMWISDLWKNPISWIASSSLLLAATSFMSILNIFKIDHSTNLYILLFSVTVSASFLGWLIVQLYLLSPHRQYVPPRLSILGASNLFGKNGLGVDNTKGELAAGGGTMGVLGGLFLIPILGPLGPLLGGVLGSLIGMISGRNFDEIRNDVATKVSQKLESLLDELDREVDEWLHRRSSYLKRSIRESMKMNTTRIRKITHLKPRILLPHYKN